MQVLSTSKYHLEVVQSQIMCSLTGVTSWLVSWPKSGTVQIFLDAFRNLVTEKLKLANVFLIFDRYYEQSIKSATRRNRDIGASRGFNRSPSTKLPSQKVILTARSNN